MKTIRETFLTFTSIALVCIAIVALVVHCGTYPKVVDEGDIPPAEEVSDDNLAEEVHPTQFVTQNSIIKYGKKCFKLVPGDGVLTVVKIDCP